MTFAQFKRLKPKYKFRIVTLCVVALLLFAMLISGISYGFAAIRRQLNTSSLTGITAQNVLLQSSMLKIQETIGQTDATRLLVIDSTLTCNEKGVPLSLEMHLVSLGGTQTAEYWQLTANEKKTILRKTQTENKNRSSLDMRKLTFRDYYPALSRSGTLQLVQYLQQNFPVGTSGRYLFTDRFDNNLEPQYAAYLGQGYRGVWVSKIGALSEFTETYNPVSFCTPLIVSAQPEDPKKSKPKKPVLLAPDEIAVALLEAGPYINEPS